MIKQFLFKGRYRRSDGSAVSLKTFTREFTRWLDDPQLQQHWCDHHRIERALRDLRIPVAYLDKRGTFVGNLSGPGSTWPFKVPRLLIDDEGWLLPLDLTDPPRGTPTSSYRVSKLLRPVYAAGELQDPDL